MKPRVLEKKCYATHLFECDSGKPFGMELLSDCCGQCVTSQFFSIRLIYIVNQLCRECEKNTRNDLPVWEIGWYSVFYTTRTKSVEFYVI